MEWVQAMSDAMHHLSYRGNFVYLHNNQLESMSISHIKDEHGEREHLLSLNGEAREIIRDNKNLTCIWPNSRKVVVGSSRKDRYSPLLVPKNVKKISKFYDFEMIGSDRIGGQHTMVVQIKPKDRYRYGLKLWINVENALMMKSHLINDENKVVEQVMFTALEVLTKSDLGAFNDPIVTTDGYTLIHDQHDLHVNTLIKEASWRIDNILTGFWQESVLKRHHSETNQLIQQMIYTDGLATLSIFIEKQAEPLKQGKMSMGAVNVFIRTIDNYTVTAIGEVPSTTVQSMAESVFYQQP